MKLEDYARKLGSTKVVYCNQIDIISFYKNDILVAKIDGISNVFFDYFFTIDNIPTRGVQNMKEIMQEMLYLKTTQTPWLYFRC